MISLATAHLITVHASTLSPGSASEIIITTRDEVPGAERIARYPLGNGGVEAGIEILRDAGWSVTSTWTRVERGYLTADIER